MDKELAQELSLIQRDWEIDGLKPCEVYAWNFSRGEPQTQYSHGEPAACNFAVFCADLDITECLTDWELEAIEEELLESYYG